jgi:hypothetical protein
VTHKLACRVTATNAAGSAEATSVEVEIPSVAPRNATPPSVAGDATRTCAPGGWYGIPVPTVEHQWLRDGTPIPDATSPAYTPSAEDAGHTLACRVRATNGAGSVEATSAGVAIPPAPPPPAAAPVAATGSALQPTLPRTPSAVATAFGLRSAKRCAGGRTFPVRLLEPKGIIIKSVTLRRDGRKVTIRKRQGRWRADVVLRRVIKGRFTIELVILTTDGRTATGKRTYRTCGGTRVGRATR